MLQVGDKAPNFTLPNENGELVSLEDLRGKSVIVYFYPKDSTPSCTKEACSFRDTIEQYEEKNTVILGISKDSQKSHKNFKEKFNLPFPLLSDPEGDVIKAFGAWGEKKMYGKTYEGILRYTYLLDEEGVVKEIITKVQTGTHGADVLELI